MFARLRARQPGAPLWRIAWWYLLHSLCYAWVGPCYRYRAWGLHNVPRTGPVLLVSNHQSFLDPILVGVGCHHRQFYAMARSTLFRHPIFTRLIRSLNAIPVERNSSDTAAIRRCLDVLRGGNALLVFPEGTRTADGAVAEFQNGVVLLAKRTGATVVPVAIQGAFDVWGRHRTLPRIHGRIEVCFGSPIGSADLVAMGSTQATHHLQGAIESMRQKIAVRPSAHELASAPVTTTKPTR